jgi:hypothetical protein
VRLLSNPPSPGSPPGYGRFDITALTTAPLVLRPRVSDPVAPRGKAPLESAASTQKSVEESPIAPAWTRPSSVRMRPRGVRCSSPRWRR